jgi:queuine tRNA-ribosyltransferase
VVETPVFMPVGTYGTVKGVMPAACKKWARRSSWATPSTCGCGPGLDVLAQFGGLHRFEGWNKPMLTDSGWLPGLEPG